MEDNELALLKEKADNGDISAKLEYAIRVNERSKNNEEQREHYYQEAWEYIWDLIKDFENFNSVEQRKYIDYGYLIYKNAKEYVQNKKEYGFSSAKDREAVDEFFVTYLPTIKQFHNLGGNVFNIKEANLCGYDLDVLKEHWQQKTRKVIDEQREVDKANLDKETVVVIPTLTTALKNEIPYFKEQIKRILDVDLSEDEIEKLNNIDIVFSYEKKQEKYAPTKEDIILLLKQLLKAIKDLGDDSYIEIVYEIKSIIRYINEFGLEDIEFIKKDLSNIRITDNDIELYKIYRKIESALSIATSETLGEYDNTNKQITLYLSNIYNKSVELKLERIELLAVNVFIHELFHAFHYLNIKSNSNIKEEDIVIESLASFFQNAYYMFDDYKDYKDDDLIDDYNYNQYRNFSNKPDYVLIRKNIRKSWQEDMFLYPYSGAKYLYLSKRYITHNFALVRKIYKKSLSFMHGAFSIIKLFYELEEDDV